MCATFHVVLCPARQVSCDKVGTNVAGLWTGLWTELWTTILDCTPCANQVGIEVVWAEQWLNLNQPASLAKSCRYVYFYCCANPLLIEQSTIHSLLEMAAWEHCLLSNYIIIPNVEVVSCHTCTHTPPGEKWSGKQSQISWAYYPNGVMTNEIVRSVIIT